MTDLLVLSLATTHFWVRFFGYGFCIRWNSKSLFSERYGYRKVYRYKKIAFEFLEPHPSICSDHNTMNIWETKEINKIDIVNDENCPVCGFYCLGKGGMGCINKPSMIKSQ